MAHVHLLGRDSDTERGDDDAAQDANAGAKESQPPPRSLFDDTDEGGGETKGEGTPSPHLQPPSAAQPVKTLPRPLYDGDKEALIDLCVRGQEGDVDEARDLIARGINIDEQNQLYGKTALMNAAAYDNLEMVQMLLRAGAALDLRTPDGDTAFLYAVMMNHLEMVQELVRAGAALDMQFRGKTALQKAREWGLAEVATLLEEATTTSSSFVSSVSSVSVFVSGGQTGGDSIPLSVHAQLGVHVKGYLPRGFKRGDGRGREIAAQYGLDEGHGDYQWRDEANAAMSDALIAFLTSEPKTGKGTMSTANIFVRGEYRFVPIAKPEEDGVDHLELWEPVRSIAGGARRACSERWKKGSRPVLVFWDIAEGKLSAFAVELRAFLAKYRPRKLMFAGSVESTFPGLERLGARLLVETWGREEEAEDKEEVAGGGAGGEAGSVRVAAAGAEG